MRTDNVRAELEIIAVGGELLNWRNHNATVLSSVTDELDGRERLSYPLLNRTWSSFSLLWAPEVSYELIQLRGYLPQELFR